MERAFQAYGEPLETVTYFKYLERLLTAGYEELPVVAGKMRKTRKIWVRMTRILSWEGADPN